MGMLTIDPRNPPADQVIRTDSDVSFHANLRKTLVLLKITTPNDPVFFVVEGLQTWPASIEQMRSEKSYFYEEHTCPTNFIRIPMICHQGDTDPHGVFEFVDCVWMTTEYDEDATDEYLLKVFPQLTASTPNSTGQSMEKPQRP